MKEIKEKLKLKKSSDAPSFADMKGGWGAFSSLLFVDYCDNMI